MAARQFDCSGELTIICARSVRQPKTKQCVPLYSRLRDDAACARFWRLLSVANTPLTGVSDASLREAASDQGAHVPKTAAEPKNGERRFDEAPRRLSIAARNGPRPKPGARVFPQPRVVEGPAHPLLRVAALPPQPAASAAAQSAAASQSRDQGPAELQGKSPPPAEGTPREVEPMQSIIADAEFQVGRPYWSLTGFSLNVPGVLRPNRAGGDEAYDSVIYPAGPGIGVVSRQYTKGPDGKFAYHVQYGVFDREPGPDGYYLRSATQEEKFRIEATNAANAGQELRQVVTGEIASLALGFLGEIPGLFRTGLLQLAKQGNASGARLNGEAFLSRVQEWSARNNIAPRQPLAGPQPGTERLALPAPQEPPPLQKPQAGARRDALAPANHGGAPHGTVSSGPSRITSISSRDLVSMNSRGITSISLRPRILNMTGGGSGGAADRSTPFNRDEMLVLVRVFRKLPEATQHNFGGHVLTSVLQGYIPPEVIRETSELPDPPFIRIGDTKLTFVPGYQGNRGKPSSGPEMTLGRIKARGDEVTILEPGITNADGMDAIAPSTYTRAEFDQFLPGLPEGDYELSIVTPRPDATPSSAEPRAEEQPVSRPGAPDGEPPKILEPEHSAPPPLDRKEVLRVAGEYPKMLSLALGARLHSPLALLLGHGKDFQALRQAAPGARSGVWSALERRYNISDSLRRLSKTGQPEIFVPAVSPSIRVTETKLITVFPGYPAPSPGPKWERGADTPRSLGKLSVTGESVEILGDGIKGLDGNPILGPGTYKRARFDQLLRGLAPGDIYEIVLEPNDVMLGPRANEWLINDMAAVMREDHTLAEAVSIALVGGYPYDPAAYLEVYGAYNFANWCEHAAKLKPGSIPIAGLELRLTDLAKATAGRLDDIKSMILPMRYAGAVTIIHCDAGPNLANFVRLSELFTSNSDQEFVLALSGPSLTSAMPANFLRAVDEILKDFPNVKIALSWSGSSPGSAADRDIITAWAKLAAKYPRRFLRGGDSISQDLQPAGASHGTLPESDKTAFLKDLDQVGTGRNIPNAAELFEVTNFEDTISLAAKRAGEWRVAVWDWLAAGGPTGGAASPGLWARWGVPPMEWVQSPDGTWSLQSTRPNNRPD
jgi:hypothetical protein